MTRGSMPPHSRSSLSGVSLEALAAIDTFRARGGTIERRDVVDVVMALADHAPALLPSVYADPLLVVDVLERPLSRGDGEATMRQRFVAATNELDDGPELRRVLRRLRHRAVVRIALREIERLADVDATSAEMAALAGAAIDAAYLVCRRSFERRHGAIVDASGAPVPFVVLGMGKLGGGELNLGSDVDLLFLYGTDEGRVGDGSTSIHEAMTRIARRLVAALEEPTEDGFCFRVDLRLRPEGTHGALVNSLASAERYYESFGRPWERAALLRARGVAGERALGEELLDALRGFVYRRMPDPSIVHEMRTMVERARRELSRHPDRDVKLGRGGIREAEFYVQTMQLLWGGQHPVLQTPSTTRALRQLRSVGLLSHRESAQLGADWALLRSVEHRIHVWNGFQSHDLPVPGAERDRFVRSLGFVDAATFDREFAEARARVAALFDGLVDDPNGPPQEPELDLLVHRVVTHAPAEDVTESVASALPVVADPVEASSHLRRMARLPHTPFGAIGYARAPELGRRLLRECRGTAYPDAAIRHLAEFFSRVGADFGYDRELVEQPTLARRLVGLFGASTTLSTALIGHPDTVDQIFAAYGSVPTEEAIREAHRTGSLFEGAEVDEEDFVTALRRRQREIVLRIGLAYIAGDADLEMASRRLSTLAECQLERALTYARRAEEAKHGAPDATVDGEIPGFAVLAMGKLGSRELGFGSDLDVVFVYEDEGMTVGGEGRRSVTHAEHFIRVGQRMLRLLSTPHHEGRGYEIDARLRPNGTQSPLVQSLPGFEAYYETQAADWERQALTRARPVAGDARLARRLRAAAERAAYDRPAPSADDVATMRGRMERELAGERPGRYHVKYGHGALLDVEFLGQWLAMVHGHDPRVRVLGTESVLRVLRSLSILGDDDTEALLDAYGLAREIEQTIKLLDDHREPVIVEDGPIADRIARRLRMRNRDGIEPGRVLVESWIRSAREVRAIFERLVAPIDASPPWSEESEVEAAIR